MRRTWLIYGLLGLGFRLTVTAAEERMREFIWPIAPEGAVVKSTGSSKAGKCQWFIGKHDNWFGEFNRDAKSDPVSVDFVIGDPVARFPHGLGTNIGPHRSMVSVHFQGELLPPGGELIVRWSPGETPDRDQFSVAVDGQWAGDSEALQGSMRYSWYTTTLAVPPLAQGWHVVTLTQAAGDALYFDFVALRELRDVEIVVATNLYQEPSIQARLQVYGDDLEKEGYRVHTTEFFGRTCGELRTNLQGRWEATRHNLAGAVLVGNLPLAQFWFVEEAYARPIDLYYMDLDGTWGDTNNDGVFDSHPNDGRQGPEIWIGRIMTHNLTNAPSPALELAQMNAYLDRVHAYREGRLPFERAGMVYSRDFQRSGPMGADDLDRLYRGATTLIMDPEVTAPEDYQEHLTKENWEWHIVIAHGSPGGHSFVGASEVHSLNPRVGFYQFDSCSFANYLENGYAAGQYIFNTDYGLAGIGFVKLGAAPLSRAVFYDTLASGETIGEAHRAQLDACAAGGFNAFEIQYYVGLTLLGDPTLRPGLDVNSNLRVASVVPALGTMVRQLTSVRVQFTQEILPATVNPGTYFLTEAGPDGLFDTPDDVSIAADVFVTGQQAAQLDLEAAYPDGLRDGLYRISITDGVTSLSGYPLDGEVNGSLPSGNGEPGGSFRSQFQVHRAGPRVVSMVPSPGLLVTNSPVRVDVRFDEPINPNSLTLKSLMVRRSGGDGIFGNGNDVELPGHASYDAGSSLASFGFYRDLGSAPATYAMGMCLDGNYAYVADWARGVRIVDISDPMHPREVSRAPVGAAAAVDVVQPYAYVANRSGGLAVVDISDPTQPSQAGSCDTPGWAIDVDTQGPYAYVADLRGGSAVVRGQTTTGNVWIIKIQDPAHPEIVNGYRVPNSAVSIRVEGNYAYVASDVGGLWILDVTDPEGQPVGGLRGWGHDTPDTACWIDLGTNSIAYLANGNRGLIIFDVHDPSHPIELASFPTAGSACRVRLFGGMAVVSDLSAGALVIDVSQPRQPKLIHRYDHVSPRTERLDAWLVNPSCLALATCGDSFQGLRLAEIALLPSDLYQVVVTDDLQDPAGRALDGDGSYSYPGPVDQFPSGNGFPEGNFVATFLLADSRVVALADTFGMRDRTTLSVPAPGILANDTDVARNPLTAELVDGPSHGTLNLNPDGSFVYTPHIDFAFGTDRFCYRASDGTGFSDIAEVRIILNPFAGCQLSGALYVDLDRDGVRDAGEPGVEGRTIQLQRIGGRSKLLQVFQKPTLTPYDRLGHSVAVVGQDILAGARSDHTSGAHAGTAYLFNSLAPYGRSARGPWCTLTNPTPERFDFFGWPVAALGSDLVVGAPRKDGGNLDSGAVYRFNGMNGQLMLRIPGPNNSYFDWFGHSFAASGNALFVGAPNEDDGCSTNAGTVYVFEANTGIRLGTLCSPTPTAGDFFGYCVATVGNRVLVGAPYDDHTTGTDSGAAYVFDGATGKLLLMLPDRNNPTHPRPAPGDNFGISVAFFGNDILVGSRYDDTGGPDTGAVYLFDGTNGNLLRVFQSPTPHPDDNFGCAIATLNDRVLVGAYKDDTGAENAGAVYLFDGKTGRLLQTFQKPTPSPYDYFGVSVAAVGNNVLVGAPYDDTGGVDAGAVYLFEGLPGPSFVTTDADGNYGFSGLEPGTYQIREIAEGNLTETRVGGNHTHTVMADHGTHLTGLDFGLLPEGVSLHIKRQNGLLVVSWEAEGFVLEESLSLAEASWRTVINQTNPFVVTPNGPARFYRLRR